MLLKKLVACLVGCLPVYAHAFQPFKVEEIEIVGLQRVDLGAVHTQLPVKVGETVTSERVPQIIRALFKTGSFEIIEVNRDARKLIINVLERPTIASIDIDGNKDIKTEQLTEAMKSSGVAPGEVLNPSILEQIQQELERQYYSYGKYGVKVDYKTVRLARNRVRIKIDIKEGDAAVIEQINIVGNKAFSEEELLEQFELSTGGWLSFFTDDNQYAKEKLTGDLETLRSYYQDRGYVKFQIQSTQVSITPNKEGIYITINIDEGDVYKVSEIKFTGDLIVEEEFLRRLVPLRPKDTYSGAAITFAEEAISKTLGYEGYAFAKVNPIPEIDEENKTVKVVFFVDPGKRTYVNRINFSGNEKTDDHVLRREMRLMEGGMMSTRAVERSKLFLERLTFVEAVNVDTPPVAGSDDMVDVNFQVKERPAGSISGAIGYNDSRGAILNASISQNNFRGAGQSVAFSVSSSKPIKNVQLSFTEPYITPDGVSNSYRLFFRKTDFGEFNSFSSPILDSWGGTYLVGIPIGEISRMTFGLNYQNNVLKSSGSLTYNIAEIFRDVGQDIEREPELDFELFSLQAIWSRNSLNRGIFPDRGMSQTLSGSVTVPGSEFEYYKLDYDFKYYIPIATGWSFLLRSRLSYGDGYGDDRGQGLPFFEFFRTGGSENLRGFRNFTVGPKEIEIIPQVAGAGGTSGSGTDFSDLNFPGSPLPSDYDTYVVRSRTIGGNSRVLGGLELIFPTPFTEDDNRSIRTSFFVDYGNVWNSDYDADFFTNLNVVDEDFGDSVRGRELLDRSNEFDNFRVSAGLSVQWLSPLGPLKFSVSKPLIEEEGDEIETIGFSVGNTF